jgi:hypothetical protein
MDYHASTSIDDRFRAIAMDGERVGRKTLFLKEIGQCLWLDSACSVAMVKEDFLDA